MANDVAPDPANDTATEADLPKSFTGLTLETPSTSAQLPGTLTITTTELTFNSLQCPTQTEWNLPLSSLNLHALSAEPDAHLYMQTGSDYEEVHVRGSSDTLQNVYDTLCIAVAQCPDEDDDEPEEALGSSNGAAMMARLDGLLQMDEDVSTEERKTEENGKV